MIQILTCQCLPSSKDKYLLKEKENFNAVFNIMDFYTQHTPEIVYVYQAIKKHWVGTVEQQIELLLHSTRAWV